MRVQFSTMSGSSSTISTVAGLTVAPLKVALYHRPRSLDRHAIISGLKVGASRPCPSRKRLALVATVDARPDAEVIAVARYEPTPEAGIAEVAFVVRDDWQNRGLGTLLCRALLHAAEARGIKQFRASVLADNPRMLDMIMR